MNDKYDEVMNLILDYGDAKLHIGMAIAGDSSAEKLFNLDDKKTVILDRICDAIIELTK